MRFASVVIGLLLPPVTQGAFCCSPLEPGGTAAPSPASTRPVGQLNELRETGDALVRAIAKGEVQAVAEMLDPGGVVFGTDPPPIPRQELLRQFAQRTGAYCVLFDTDCLRREEGESPNRARIHSLRELIQGADKREIVVNIAQGDEGPFGQVSVELSGGPADQNPGGPGIDFAFRYDGRRWKLAHVEYL